MAPLAVSELYDHLDRLYPGIRKRILVSCALTINEEYVSCGTEDGNVTIIHEGDEVAIIPPVSSG